MRNSEHVIAYTSNYPHLDAKLVSLFLPKTLISLLFILPALFLFFMLNILSFRKGRAWYILV